MKAKIKKSIKLTEALDLMGSIVKINDKTYKFLPYWFEFEGNNVFANHLDETPNELAAYVKKMAARVDTKKVVNPINLDGYHR